MTPIGLYPLLENQRPPFNIEIPVPSKFETDKIEKIFKDLKKDFDTGFNLLANLDSIFKRATATLNRTLWLCIGSALLAAAGGIGAAACKRKYKKTRIAFALLAIAGAGVSCLSAYMMHKMQTSLMRLQPLVERRWKS
jgi:hypothetical protein